MACESRKWCRLKLKRATKQTRDPTLTFLAFWFRHNQRHKQNNHEFQGSKKNKELLLQPADPALALLLAQVA